MRILIAALAVAGLTVPAAAAPTNVSAVQSTIRYNNTPAGPTYFSTYARATTVVVYDSVTDTYTLRDTGSPTTKSTFGPGNIDAGASNATFTVYRKTSGSTTETFRLLNQDPTNPLIVLSYVTYGQWRRSTASGSSAAVNDTFVVFGQKTPAASVPRTGSGSYSTVLDGIFVNSAGVYAVTGTGNLTANFGAGTISYDATASGAREGGGPGIAFGTMTGSGSIAFNGGTYSGTGTANGNGYALDLNGAFYGPAAQEVGGTFRIRGNRGNGTGAFVGN